MLRARVFAFLLPMIFALAPSAAADEGQWTPDQIAELDQAELKRLGLELSPEQIWSADGGLLRAAINLSGCSASFVSAQGLIATNHHCAYGALQAASSVEHDYLSNGFLAATNKEELEAKGRTVKVLQRVEDVTKSIAAITAKHSDPRARAQAARQEVNRLVAACEAQDQAPKCQVAGFYNGSIYRLFEYLELRDIRVAYAPASSIGEYGGETDNWMWPRHTGDFTLMRAYVGPDGKPADYSEQNVPYAPKHFLKIGHQGVAPGDFVAVLGYPGRTNRYLPAPEVKRWLEQVFPARIDVYGEWIATMEALGEKDDAVRIKVAAKIKSLANRHKNARGMVDGITRMNLLGRREAEDEKLVDWAKAQQDEAYAAVIPDLGAMSQERAKTHRADFLLENVSRTSDTLAIAIDLVRRAREQKKPDLERVSAYMDRSQARLWKRQEGRLRDFDPAVDEALLSSLFKRHQELAAEQQFIPAKTPQPATLVRQTKLSDKDTVKALFDGADLAAIEASRDPMLVLARSIVKSIEQMEARGDTIGGRMLELGPKYFEMLKAVRTGPVYPDANGTLRFSYATVKGYSPRDGLTATPQTTLAGAVDKHTGEAPFDLPASVIAAAGAAGDSYWADPVLEDVPLCFLSNADTTGGNSGSPVVNGRGELVGLNFDRVWENIAGDFGYNPARSRNVTVDIRYLLWLLDDVADAGHLLEEMSLTSQRDAKRRAVQAVGPASLQVAPARADGAPPAQPGCSCRAGEPVLGGLPAAFVLCLAGFGRRRARRA